MLSLRHGIDRYTYTFLDAVRAKLVLLRSPQAVEPDLDNVSLHYCEHS